MLSTFDENPAVVFLFPENMKHLGYNLTSLVISNYMASKGHDYAGLYLYTIVEI